MTVSGLKPIGIKSGYSLSNEAISALQRGDVGGLLAHHKGRWGGFTMDGDDDSDDDKKNKDGKDSGDSGSGDDADDDDGSGGSDDDKSGADDDLKAQLQSMEKRMKAADQRASKAEKSLKDIEDGKKDDLTKAQEENVALKETVTELQTSLQGERLSNAFLAANKHTWHKPGTALKLAQSEGYLDDAIGEDGTVNEGALSSALAKLAKEHEYLIKKGDGSGSSGSPASGRSGNGKDDKALKTDDQRRAPALRRR